jgi:hypothetical protein
VGTTQQFTLDQIEMTKAYLNNAKGVIMDLTVSANMETPYRACPGGTTYDQSDPRAYLCQQDIAQLAQWTGSSDGVKDPWKSDFTGYVVRKPVTIFASSQGTNVNFVTVPVTAMVLVSPGPDRKLDKQLQDDLSALNSGSSLRDVLRIAARDQSPGTCSPGGTVSCDDIVMTFSDQDAQYNRWQAVQSSVGRIAYASLRHYQVQFLQYLPQLADLYKNNASLLFDSSGTLIVSDTNINGWKKLAEGDPAAPDFGGNDYDLSDKTKRTALGVDSEFNYITDDIAAGGSGLNLSRSVEDSTDGKNDVLVIKLTNRSSPWSGAGGLTYTVKVDASNVAN